MSLIRWNSVRVRLTLWNVAVLALVLGGFGMTLCYHVQAEIQASVDRQLRSIPRFIPGSSSPFRGGGPGFGPEGPGPGGRRRSFGPGRGRGFEGRRPDTPGAAGTAMRVPRGPASENPFAEPSEEERRRFGFFRHPRLLTTEGAPFLGSDGEPVLWESGEGPWDPATVASAAAGAEQFSTVRIDGETVRVLSAPILRNGQVTAVIQFPRLMSDQQRFANDQVRTLIALLPLALLVAGVGGVFLTDRALRPVRNVTQAAAEIGAADLSRRLEVAGQDEFAELARTFNGMIARLDEAFQRLENAYQRLEQAFEQQRRFTADASHELRTPLTRIKASVSLALADQRDAGAYRKALQVVDAAANAMNRLIQDLLLLARADADQLKLDLHPLSVAELLEDAVDDVPDGMGCPIMFQLPEEPVEVLGDRDALDRLLSNLIANALRHTPRDGQITLAAHAETDSVVIRVEDTGEGIPPEHLPHICDRFYRVDEARTRSQGGTGLGLAICKSIAEAHGGTLSIESVPGYGTTVHVRIPRALGRPVDTPVGLVAHRE
jgi:signal transduction histidine kinase